MVDPRAAARNGQLAAPAPRREPMIMDFDMEKTPGK